VQATNIEFIILHKLGHKTFCANERENIKQIFMYTSVALKFLESVNLKYCHKKSYKNESDAFKVYLNFYKAT